MAHDSRAQIPGRLGERIANARRVAMPVVPGPGGGQHVLGGKKRIEAPDLVKPDDLHAEADALREADVRT